MLRISFINQEIPFGIGGCATAPYFAFGTLDETQHSILDEAQVSYNRGSGEVADRFVVKSFSSNIIFYKDAARYLKSLLLQCNQGNANFVNISIFDDCCGSVIFEGNINKNSIQYCEVLDGTKNECEIKVKIDNKSDLSSKYDCLTQTLVMKRDTLIDGVRFDQFKHPFIKYCKEFRPKIIQDIIFAAFLVATELASILMIPFFILFVIIDTIVAVLNTLPGVDIDFNTDKDGNQSIQDVVSDFFADNAITLLFSGCGKGHLAPLVRDLFTNACVQCGMRFESSILNDPNSIYYNLTFLQAGAELNGTKYYDNNGNIIAEAMADYYKYNSINMSGLEFANKIAGIFNSYWDIVPDGAGFKLIFENQKIVPITWIDFEDIDNAEKIKEICFDSEKKEGFAYLELKYSDDPTDSVSSESKLVYDDKINWKSPLYGNQNNPNLTRLETPFFEFARARFRNAREGTRDVISYWLYGDLPNFAYYIPSLLIILAEIRLLTNIDFFTTPAKDWRNWLVLNSGLANMPKLIVLENDYDYRVAKSIKCCEMSSDWSYAAWYYNTPMWFADNEDLNDRGKPYLPPHLSDFWLNKNPKSDHKEGMTFSLTLQRECGLVNGFADILQQLGFNFRLRLPYVGKFVDTFEITQIVFTLSEIRIQGTI